MQAANPAVITSICGNGPVKVLDVATVPSVALLPVVGAAIQVVNAWGGAEIETDSSNAKASLDELAQAIDALEAYSRPVIPGAPYTVSGNLIGVDAFPVLRAGKVEQVKTEDLTAIELEAVQRWLRFHADATARRAEEIRQRHQEVLAERRSSGYVEAPPSDWRL